MKRVFIILCFLMTFSVKADDQIEQTYFSTKNTISEWNGYDYSEVLSSYDRAKIYIVSDFIYLKDDFGNQITYKYSGFYKNKPKTLITTAIDDKGNYCQIIINELDGGKSFYIIYENQSILKYYCQNQ